MNEQEANILHLTPVGEVQSNIKTPILIANDSDIELHPGPLLASFDRIGRQKPEKSPSNGQKGPAGSRHLLYM